MFYKTYFFAFFAWFAGFYTRLWGQEIANNDVILPWQEQLWEQVDVASLGEESCQQLVDEMEELITWNDTLTPALLPDSPTHGRVWLQSNRTLSTRAGYQAATDTRRAAGKAYLGDAWHHSLRCRVRYTAHYEVGLSGEKDAGEAWQSRFPLFDSWHAFVCARDITLPHSFKIATAVAGHYRLGVGCGLVMGQTFSLGKQYMVAQIHSMKATRLTPVSSNVESGYMQGFAADIRLPYHLALLPYCSYRRVDGTLTNGLLTAMQTTGYHRTATEDAHREAAGEWVAGARLGIRGEWYELGLHLSHTALSHPYSRAVTYYNRHYFRGQRLTSVALDYALRVWQCSVRGEWAVDQDGGMASLVSVAHDWPSSLKMSVIHRYYSSYYHALHASSLGENSELQGEQGVMLTAAYELSRRWQLDAMADYFYLPYPQYGIKRSPTQGFEAWARGRYHRRKTDLSVAYRVKRKGDYARQQMECTFRYEPLPTRFSLKTQGRFRVYDTVGSTPASKGFAVSQAATYHTPATRRVRATVEGQCCYFDTDDYDSRIYLSERALPSQFGLTSFYGQGIHYNAVSSCVIGTHVALDLRFTVTQYAHRGSISSGLQQIKGNTQTDGYLQLRIMW